MTKEHIKKFSELISRTAHNYAFFFYTAIFILIVIFLLTTTLTAHLKNEKLKGHYQQLTQEIEETKQTNHRLQQETNALTEDPFYLEMFIRDNLRMLGKGEIIIKDTK